MSRLRSNKQMNEGNKQLKVFFLEDNPDDVDIELYELKRAGFEVEYDVARNRKEFLEKLPDLNADIMLADYALPDITGIEAIGIFRKMDVDVPVILITGEGNELIAVDSLRIGAIDYIIKRNISGLPARVSRALEIWADRKAKQRAEAEGKRLQQILFEGQKMEAIGRLACGIAHDFNNILTGIMGFSEMCLDDVPQDSVIRKKLQTIITLSQGAADLAKQLLIFSKKMSMEFEVIDLNAFVMETMRLLTQMVEETVEIKLELQEDIPKIKCDTGKFTQVLMNLILNARDAMNGSGIIKIKSEKCLLTEGHLPETFGTYCKECVCFSVSDTGAGIDKDDIQKIFEPFFTTKGVGKGTGLGLAIVYSVVNEHGGRIEVFSEKGAGTTFKIYLPLLQTDTQVQNISV